MLLICLAVLLTVNCGGVRPEWRGCPVGCLCDEEASLVSCAGLPDDEEEVTRLWNNGTGGLPPVDGMVWTLAGMVQRLDLRDWNLTRLQPVHLSNGTSLKELSLVRCELEDIEEGSLARQDQLERLDLSQNALTVLTQGMLRGLIRLRSLDVSSNRLTRIEDGALQSMPDLEQLNMRDNSIATIGPDVFKGLSRLEFLNLDGNNVTVIADSAFQDLSQLAHLILSRNPLNGGLTHVDLFGARAAYVDLSSAGLERVPSIMARYVRDLRLSGNKLGRLQSGDFDSVLQVRLLVLDESEIGEVEEDALGRLDSLEILSLDGNILSVVPASLPGKSLAALHLEANRIKALRAGDFAGLRRLDQLHLGRNGIESIESGTFHQLTSLTQLNLKANRLTTISRDLFSGLPRLKVLDLSDNPLVLHRADAEGLRHLTALVKVLIPAHLVDEMAESVSPATPIQLVADTTTRSTTARGVTSAVTTATTDRAKNQRRDSDEDADGNNGTSNEGLLPALMILATLACLSVIVIAAFVTAGGWLRRWRGPGKNNTAALWKRRRNVMASGLQPQYHPGDSTVKLGWVPAEDFDHWSAALLQNGSDTEHERLLLAVSPHH